jgi:hypothetical protein
MGAGMVMRDHHGTCLAACRQHIDGLQTPEYAEALALRRAVQLALEEQEQSLLHRDTLEKLTLC